MRFSKRFGVSTLLAIVVLVTLFVGIRIMNANSASSFTPGIKDGRLAACPDKPNCVSSQASDNLHAIAPLQVLGDPDSQWNLLIEIVNEQPRATIVDQSADYLRAEFSTLILRFVDDVEFLLDRDHNLIHFRSASRTGYSDFGVNRKRLETIRGIFSARTQLAQNSESRRD